MKKRKRVETRWKVSESVRVAIPGHIPKIWVGVGQGQRARINTLSNASDVLGHKTRKHNANPDRNLSVASHPLSCVAVPSFQSQA